MHSQQNTEHVLFPFDNRALPFSHGVRLKLIPFASAADSGGLPNMVVSPGPDGTPDSRGILYYGTVLQVGAELWMWYLGQGEGAEKRRHFRVCFAKSRDGRKWEKPNLGLVEYSGSKDNNLVDLGGGGFPVVGCVVFYDTDEAEAGKRFKMFFESPKYRGKFAVAYSPDGVRWVESPGNPRGPFFEPAGGIKWNGVYHVNGQAHDAHFPAGVRKFFTHQSCDFENWTQVGCLGFRRDSVPPKPMTTTGPVDGEQVHLGAGLWHRGNVVVGFYGQWHGHPSNDRRWVSIDLGLVISHDALHFHEPVPDFRIVQASEAVSWLPPANFPFERASALMQGQGFANIGDETLFWYSVWGIPDAGIRLARWGRDRLGYLAVGGLESWMDPNHSPHIISAPLMPKGDSTAISVNVDGLGEYSSLKVSILDEQFRPLPGFTAQDCTGPAQSGFRQRVAWGAKDRVPVQGAIRIRADFAGVRPEDIHLYAIYLEG
jgi:hypothetical protein